MGRSSARSLRVATALLALAASASFAPAARGQEIVRQWFGDASGQSFGNPIVLIGDVNADGFIDVAVGAPYDDTVNPDSGMLRVVSGRDGAVLYTIYGDSVGAAFGAVVSPIGDVDLDGNDDILASEPGYGGPYHPPGRIFVFSGRDGSVLRTFDGSYTQTLRSWICGTGDVDGDGVPDFAATSSNDSANGTWVTLFSGATSAVIRTLIPTDPTSNAFGQALLNPGDIDGDGVNDLIVVEDGCYATNAHYYAFSGATGSLIWETNEQFDCYSRFDITTYALSPVVIGDVNGDGIADWSMGTNWLGPYGGGGGFVSCFSGKDGSLLLKITNPIGSYPAYGSTFGDAIASAGDVNGDGVPDVAASDFEHCDDAGGDVFFYSGVDGAMLFHARGSASATQFGQGLAGGADTDGNGKLDLYAGDDWDSTNGPAAGAVTQVEIEPIVLDVFPRLNPSRTTRVDVNGGIPGNPLAIFLVDVNGTTLFDLIEFATFNSSRRFEQNWRVPNGLTGITVRLLALTIDANGRLLKSNHETITFP